MNPSPFRIALLCLVPLLGCDKKTGVQKATETGDSLARAASHAERPLVRIAAAASPIAWLGCQVAGEPCEPMGLVPPGAPAHSWEPKPSDLARIESVDAWLRTGLSFESAWTPRLQSTFPKLPVLDLRGALDLESEEGGSHRGGEERDPHVWASPRAMKVLAETLAVRLVAQRPDLKERVAIAMPRVRMRLDSLDAEARTLLAPWSGRTFLVNHPALGYLARDYGLVQKSLESHGRELTPVDLFELRRIARAQGLKAVFVQRGASDRVARSIGEEIGIPLVPIDLMASPWDSAFRATIELLAQGL